MNASPQAAAQQLRAQQATLASGLVQLQFERQPEWLAREVELGRQRGLEDANFLLSFLAQAVDAGRSDIFHDYIAWAKVMLARRDVPAEDLAHQLRLLRGLLLDSLPADVAPQVIATLDVGLLGLPQMLLEVPSFLDPAAPLADLAHDCMHLLLGGDRREASRRVLAEAQAGTPIRQIYLEVFQRCQRELGRLWQLNQISVAQEHYCTASTQLIMSQLYPYIFVGHQRSGNLVATCVSGDLHEIGLRIVADLFEMAGWNTYYLGANTPAQGVLQMLTERKAHVLAISATLAIHLEAVRSLIMQVRADPACARVKVLVGGSPFNQSPELWRQFGADAFAPDADQAIALAARWAESK